MIAVRVVQGARVLAEVHVEASAETTTIEIADRPAAAAPPPTPPPPQPRTWPAALAWTALGVAGSAAATLAQTSFWSPWNHTRWIGLADNALWTAIGLPMAAGVLVLVLKVAGRRARMVDVLRAFARLVWLFPAVFFACAAADYPLSPAQSDLFQSVFLSLSLSVIVSTLAGIRREPRSLKFTTAWASCTLALILGLSALGGLSRRERGEPTFHLDLYPPIAGYAGRAESLDDYLASIRSAAEASAQEAAGTAGAAPSASRGN